MQCPWWIFPLLLWYGWPLALVPLLSGNPQQALLVVGWEVAARNLTDVLLCVATFFIGEFYLFYLHCVRIRHKVHDPTGSNDEPPSDNSELEGARLAQASRRFVRWCMKWHVRLPSVLFLLLVVFRETGYLDAVKESTFDECVWAHIEDKCGWLEQGCRRKNVEACLQYMSPDLRERVHAALTLQDGANPEILRKFGLATDSSADILYSRIMHLGKPCGVCMRLYPVWKETSMLDPMARALQTSTCVCTLFLSLWIFVRLLLEQSLLNNGGKRYFLLWFLGDVKGSGLGMVKNVRDWIAASMKRGSSENLSRSSESRAATSTRGSVEPVDSSELREATSTRESVETAPPDNDNQGGGQSKGIYNNTRLRTAKRNGILGDD